MNIDKLTLGQLKEIQGLLNHSTQATGSLNEMVGKKAIIRTFAAGVWFGTVSQKAGNEVILTNARRMWRWQTKKSISLSSCAIYGIDHEKSKITEAVGEVWLKAIEIIPCTNEAIKSIDGAENVSAK